MKLVSAKVSRDIATSFEPAGSGCIEPPEADYATEIWTVRLMTERQERGFGDLLDVMEEFPENIGDMIDSEIDDYDLELCEVEMKYSAGNVGTLLLVFQLTAKEPCGRRSGGYEKGEF